MNLVKSENKLPLKAYPDEMLNAVIIELSVWLSGLLSLTDETSAKRLEVALPAIKEHCWGMGLHEVKKMFEMYADYKLGMKPIPNYFDRVLLGKIAHAYKLQKPKVMIEDHQEKPSKEEVDHQMNDRITELYLEYSNSKRLSGVLNGVYQYLFDSGKLPKHDSEFKNRIFDRAKKIAKAEAMTRTMSSMDEKRSLKMTLGKIAAGKDGSIRVIAKRLILCEYFDELIKSSNEK